MAWGDESWAEFNWLQLSGSTAVSSTPQTAGEEEQSTVLGKDIMFDGDYHVSQKKDFVLLEGMPALRQAILHRLITKPGEFRTRPSYGVGVLSFVKKQKTSANLDQLKQRIEDQLSFETRIEEVSEINVESFENGLKISVAIKVAGKSLNFQPFIFDSLGERTLDVE